MGFEHQKLLSGLIRLHVLHHAARESIYGNWMIGELARHGYQVSAGTLYPLLHGMERDGYLVSTNTRSEGHILRLYRATAKGHRALREAKSKIRELFNELVDEDSD